MEISIYIIFSCYFLNYSVIRDELKVKQKDPVRSGTYFYYFILYNNIIITYNNM